MKQEQERVPLRTILQNFINHVENLDNLSDDCYDKEFQSLKLFSETLKNVKQFACTEGEKDVNKKKNRYKDILPFDYTRVVLSGIAGVQGSDYVNANFIKGASGSLAYIASQGPLPHTASDFWRMVVQCEVQVIVMACNVEESGKHKCEHYWVEREGEERQFGMANIRLIKASVVCPDFLVRTMLLRYLKDGVPVERTVCQFHYSAWPDHGVPPLVRPLLDMVRLVRDTQASETLPVLVHCSAGCGRTGTICAIDYVWGLLRAGKLTADFSLLQLVRDMRRQRIAMVQTREQYVLVHRAVRELFHEQLRMIDAHPYENVDLHGLPLGKPEPAYESLERLQAEKHDGEKEPRVAPPEPQGEAPAPRGLLPLPHTKQEKEAENQSQKQQLWSEVESKSQKQQLWSEPETQKWSEPEPSSSAADSGLSTSSTDSGERLPKRRPLATPSHKPRIAKLKALFERSSTPGKARPSQHVVRSHSLGAVRGGKFSQLPADTPLYKKLFSSKDRKKEVDIQPSVFLPQSERPVLPVKRSKSLKVVGSGGELARRPPEPRAKETSSSSSSAQAARLAAATMSSEQARSKEYVNICALQPAHRSHRASLEEAQRLVEDCRSYLQEGQQQDAPQLGPETGEQLSAEAQRKINTIVSGLGIRERRNSFRRAVCREGGRDYEPIWLQDSGGLVLGGRGEDTGGLLGIQDTGGLHDTGVLLGSREEEARVQLLGGRGLQDTGVLVGGRGEETRVQLLSGRGEDTRVGGRVEEARVQLMGVRGEENGILLGGRGEEARVQLLGGRGEDTGVGGRGEETRMGSSSASSSTSSSSRGRRADQHLPWPMEPMRADQHPPIWPVEPVVRLRPQPLRRDGLEPLGGAPQPLAPPRSRRQGGPALEEGRAWREPIYVNSPSAGASRGAPQQTSRASRALPNPSPQTPRGPPGPQQAWRGVPALGVDLDAVAASMSASHAEGEASTPLARAMGRLHSKASSLRSRLAPRDPESAPPAPDTRPPAVTSVPSVDGSTPRGTTKPCQNGLSAHRKQQYL